MSGSLDHSPAQIVAQLLIDLGLGTDPADDGSWPVYDTSLVDSPDNAICVYDTQGNIDGHSMTDGEVQEHYGVMVRVRAIDHLTGQAKANAVAQGMDTDVRNDVVSLGGKTYLVMQLGRKSGPLNNGPEPTSSRVVFTINYLAALKQLV